jgi:hypothetical protein
METKQVDTVMQYEDLMDGKKEIARATTFLSVKGAPFDAKECERFILDNNPMFYESGVLFGGNIA